MPSIKYENSEMQEHLFYMCSSIPALPILQIRFCVTEEIDTGMSWIIKAHPNADPEVDAEAEGTLVTLGVALASGRAPGPRRQQPATSVPNMRKNNVTKPVRRRTLAVRGCDAAPDPEQKKT